MRRLARLLVPCMFVLAPAAARADPLALPSLPTEVVVLSNGLRVLLAPDPTASLVSVHVAYATGSADEPDGKRGLAHLTEHLVASQTRHVRAVLPTLVSAGATGYNAQTGRDATTYFETLPPERLETALWVESDRMGFAADAVSDARVTVEIGAIANEMRDAGGAASDSPAQRVVLRQLLPAWHPYADLTSDAPRELARLRADDVRAWLHTWYTPPNAALAIAGRFDRDPTLALVRRYFEPLPGLAPPPRPPLPPFEVRGVRMTISAPVFADTVTVGWSTAPFGTPDDAALDLLASMLTGHRDPLLTGSLFDRHLVTSLSTRQFSHRVGSEFVLYAVCAPGAPRQVVAREIEKIVRGLPSILDEGGVAQAHAAWKATILSQLETPAGRAAMLTGQWGAGVDADRVSDWGLSLHVAAGRDALARTAAHWLPWSRAVVVTMIADRWAPREGRLESREAAEP